MNNNLAEIKILITGLLQDIESLESADILPLYKWEDIMISLDIIKHKLNTHKYEQERLELREITSRLNNLNSVNSNISDTIQDLEDYPEPASLQTQFFTDDIAKTDITHVNKIEERIPEKVEEKEVRLPEILTEVPVETKAPEQSSAKKSSGVLFNDEPEEDIEFELFDDTADTILDAAMKAKPNWKKDYPGTRINDMNEGITFNDKIVFLNDLFYGDTDQYRLSISRLNEFTNLNEAVEYLRMAFPEWNENSDTVYRFYMILRRKLDV